jgi:nucleoside-diphosphate-sugar epimerase
LNGPGARVKVQQARAPRCSTRRSATNGKHANYGNRAVNGEYQYAKHKIMNEWQAHDYGEKFGMLITGIRPANVTSPDQVRGSVEPAAGMRAAIISSITRLVSEFGVQYRHRVAADHR